METWALNHHFWKPSPPIVRTAIIDASDAIDPQTETTENAAAHIGVDNTITPIVMGGENLEGNDLTLFSWSLIMSI